MLGIEWCLVFGEGDTIGREHWDIEALWISVLHWHSEEFGMDLA